MKAYIFIISTLSILLFTACDKVKEIETVVNFDITSTIANQEFNLGDTIRLDAFISANKNINTWRASFKKTVGGQVKYNYKIVNSDTATVRVFWVNDLETGGDIQVDLEADMQPNGGDPRIKTIFFKCKQ